MPRRKERDSLAVQIGQGLRALRLERKLSLAQVVWACDLPGRQFLMNVESGRARPSLRVLTNITGVLQAKLSDVVSLPEQSEFERLLPLVRLLDQKTIERLLDEVERLSNKNSSS